MKLLYQIAITLIPGVGDINAKKLISYCGGVEAVFSENKSALLKIPGIGLSTTRAILNKKVYERAEKELKFIEKYKIKTLYFLDKHYPSRLKNCIDSPVLLYYKGDADLNSLKILSVVGTRRISNYGKKVCKEIIEGLVDADVLVVSGLAYGVDALAHKISLDSNLRTVAVLAHGLDRIYPSANKNLAEKMLEKGGLLTDFLSGTNPDRENFPKRNRIVAGLSDATLVIESGVKGGALITAEIANSYNRDVFAVPGRTNDKFSEGCNFLIKTNRAALIQNANDIKYMLSWDEKTQSKPLQKQMFVDLSKEDEQIFKVLEEHESLSIDQISQKCNFQTSKTASILLNLEFKGVVQCLPGKVYKIND